MHKNKSSAKIENRMKKGKLIVIEGTDGSGKATQLKLLINYLKENKKPYTFFDFPQYEKSFFGNFAGRFLASDFGHISRVNPYLIMFPFAADRWQAKNKIKLALNQGKLVVSNRYATSIAYQAAKVKQKNQQEFLRWSHMLEYQIFGIPKEDLVLFLYVPFYIAQKLIEKKKQRSYLDSNNKDQHEEDVDYLKKVEKMYIKLYQQKKNWIKIDCVVNNKLLSPQEIHQRVIEILRKKDLI